MKPFFQLDPRTKIILMIVLNFLVVKGGHIGFEILIALIPFVLLYDNKQKKLAFTYLILYVFAIVAKQATSMELHPGISAVVIILVGLIFKIFPGLMMGAYLIRSTKVSVFISAMEKWHLPRSLVIPISVLFRFFPTVSEENRAIKNAMKMRGISLGSQKFFKNPILFFEYRLIPLMASSARIGDELSSSALVRGLENPCKRTNFEEASFQKIDFVFIIFSAIAFVFMFFKG